MQASCNVGTAATSWVIGFYILYLQPKWITVWQLHEFPQSKYIWEHTRACPLPLPPPKKMYSCVFLAGQRLPNPGDLSAFPFQREEQKGRELSDPRISSCLTGLSEVFLAAILRTPTTEVPHFQRLSLKAMILLCCYWFCLIISVKALKT